MPVEGVAPSDLRDRFGNPRAGGRHHEGVDLFAPRGTRVVAATEGLVSRIGTDPLGGLVVAVLGPAGQTHYSAHLDAFAAIRVGDRVEAGDGLGAVGTTGDARGGPPHLHYGIHAAGRAINPDPILATAPPRTIDRRTTARGQRPGSHRAASG